jgi:hypothetical protein
VCWLLYKRETVRVLKRQIERKERREKEKERKERIVMKIKYSELAEKTNPNDSVDHYKYRICLQFSILYN